MTVNVVPQISASIQRQAFDITKYSKQLESLKLADELPSKPTPGRIDVLVGSDYYLDFFTFERINLGKSLYLLGSKFGWILTGRLQEKRSSKNDYSMLILNINNQSVPALSELQPPDKCCPVEINTEDFWNLETIGIKGSECDVDDETAICIFNRDIQYVNGRYQVKWPWRVKCPVLPTNYKLSFRRLKSLLRRFSSNSDFLERYNKVIQDQLQKGVIEKVQQDLSTSSLVHYIPHQAVVTPNKTTTKVCIVYDASAKTTKDAASLNECLLRGPVILENLCGLLMRFRLHRIGVVADIEKAFLQVGIQEQDRDAVRFLWLSDPARCTTDNNLQVYRFCRVPFGVISSPFLLSATVRHHLKKAQTSTANQIAENMYVDNMITGVSSVEKAKTLYVEGKCLFQKASMNLREWTSNNAELMSVVDEKDKCHEVTPKVLGIVWNIAEDSLRISNVKCQWNEEKTTKRCVFKSIAQFFDPLGLLSPTLVRGKLFLQDLWAEGLKWDDSLSDQKQKEWTKLIQDLTSTSTISISRCLDATFDTEEKKYSLMCFCDASSKAYAAVVYLRWSNKFGETKTKLLFSKTRLAPVKRQTIPRLELLAVVIGVRVLKFVEDQLKITVVEKCIWSDSQCVLNWIGSSKIQSVFIENRLKEIRSHKNTDFRYVYSEENPADLPSRGMSTTDLNQSSLWWQGPCWLSSPSIKWISTVQLPAEGIENAKARPSILFEASLTTTEAPTATVGPFAIDKERYSSLTKLLRTTAWCYRFVSRCRINKTPTSEFLNSEEIKKARTFWEKAIQQAHYTSSITATLAGRKNESVEKFDLFVDGNGILRCEGRLKNAGLNEDTKFPILLPKDDHFAFLVITDAHQRLFHAGSGQTLAHLRSRYWIPQGRRQVNKVLGKCRICQRYTGGPYKVPVMPSYPSSRVSQATPFTTTGVDCFGPLYIKSAGGRKKTWVCLFTCATVRAINLDMLSDLSAEEFLMSFRRLIARRGSPALLISDNGTNLQASSKVIQAAWRNTFKDQDVQSYFSKHAIDWKFIPQYSPWMGGSYERLIGIVKNSLRKAFGKLCLGYAQLQTLISEVEAVVNSRPLVYVGTDVTCTPALTPSHFLSLNPNVGCPSGDPLNDIPLADPDYRPTSDTAGSLLELWKKGQSHFTTFWLQWQRQYLVALRERYQKFVKQPHHISSSNPHVGDVVLIKEDFVPRGSWKIARVSHLIKSDDGECRAAKVVLSSKKETVRPIALLYPLESALDYSHKDNCVVINAQHLSDNVNSSELRYVHNFPSTAASLEVSTRFAAGEVQRTSTSVDATISDANEAAFKQVSNKILPKHEGNFIGLRIITTAGADRAASAVVGHIQNSDLKLPKLTRQAAQVARERMKKWLKE